MDDDTEYEVTYLREGGDHRTGAAAGRTEAALFQPRLTRRQRLWRGAAASGVVALALVALLAGIPSASGVVARLLPATPTVRAGANVVFAARGVPWGRLTVDGQPMAYTSDGQPLALFLPGGRHSVRYVAPPFSDLTCVVSAPRTSADTCPLLNGLPGTDAASGGNIRTIDLGAIPERLPASTRNALVAAVASNLNAADAVTVVLPGGRYLGAGDAIRSTKAPLQAGLSYTLNADTGVSVPVGDGESCVVLCDDPFAAYDATVWIVGADAWVNWRYVTAGGSTLNLPVVPSGGPAGGENVLVDLAVRWQNGWQVRPLASGRAQDLCSLASAWLYSQRSLQPTSTYSVSGSTRAARDPLTGCLLTIQFEENGHPVGAAGHYLYSFGLILAANEAAHQMDPGLPVATASEAALAITLANS